MAIFIFDPSQPCHQTSPGAYGWLQPHARACERKVLKADPNGMETWQNLQDLSSVVVFQLDVLVGMKLLLLVSNPNN